MSFAKLSDQEQQIIFQSINAILKGHFLDGEFQTRLGIEPDELEQIAVAYPHVDDSDDDSNAAIAINGSRFLLAPLKPREVWKCFFLWASMP